MHRKIFVMGATGSVGRALVKELVSQEAVVRAATRDPERRSSDTSLPIEWVEFDLECPEGFRTVLEDVDRVFMISRPGDEEADRYAAPFIEAMQASGVQHVVNLSAMGTQERPDFSLRKVEQLIEASGIPFTHLRPNFFMQVYSTGSICQMILHQRQIRLPAADAKLSLIDARDIASVACAVLVEPQQHEGQAYTLTGSQAIDHKEMVHFISEATGFEVEYFSIEDDEARKMLQMVGFSEDSIVRLLKMYQLVRLGACEPVTSDVEEILGRPSIDFGRFAADNVDCWLK